MARACTYLNFANSTEEAFRFYAAVFGTEIARIARFSEIPPAADAPPLPESVGNLVMHAELPILPGYALMGTDAPPEMGFELVEGNNAYVYVEPDTRAETERLFRLLSDGGDVETPLQEMFWGRLSRRFQGQVRDALDAPAMRGGLTGRRSDRPHRPCAAPGASPIRAGF